MQCEAIFFWIRLKTRFLYQLKNNATMKHFACEFDWIELSRKFLKFLMRIVILKWQENNYNFFL